MTILLPSFKFIGGKERMKLLRNFHLTKFFLIFVYRFYELKNKKIYNKRNNEVVI